MHLKNVTNVAKEQMADFFKDDDEEMKSLGGLGNLMNLMG